MAIPTILTIPDHTPAAVSSRWPAPANCPSKRTSTGRAACNWPNERGFGLLGSGLFIINPPHTLKAQLHAALPVLVRLLGQFAGAGHRLETAAGV